MKVKVLFFGATADLAGTRETSLELTNSASVAVVGDLVLETYTHLQNLKLLFAVNEEYVGPQHTICDGDELAVFTPVSGG